MVIILTWTIYRKFAASTLCAEEPIVNKRSPSGGDGCFSIGCCQQAPESILIKDCQHFQFMVHFTDLEREIWFAIQWVEITDACWSIGRESLWIFEGACLFCRGMHRVLYKWRPSDRLPILQSLSRILNNWNIHCPRLIFSWTSWS